MLALQVIFPHEKVKSNFILHFFLLDMRNEKVGYYFPVSFSGKPDCTGKRDFHFTSSGIVLTINEFLIEDAFMETAF